MQQYTTDLCTFVCRALILVGDLTRQRVDAIVNPTSVELRHGGGASKCIADGAGLRLTNECRDYIQRNGNLSVSVPMHTTAGLLNPPIRHVIHVAGPDATGGVDLHVAGDLLTRTFYNCLVYANSTLNVRSIAVPAISSGNFYCTIISC